MRTYRLYQRAFVFFCALWLGYLPASAQTTTPTTVTVNFNAKRFDKALPFDEVFYLKGSIPDGVNRVTVTWARKKESFTKTWTREDKKHVSAKEFVVRVGPLKPNKEYTFSFALHTPTSPSSTSLKEYRLSLATPVNTINGAIKEVKPLSVISTKPAHGTTEVPTHATITINFSRKVNVADGGVTLECPTSTPVDVTGLPASNTSSLVLKPKSPLPKTKECTVTVKAADVSDANAQTMAENHTFTFKTSSDNALPFVIATTPADKDTGISTNTDITINFSEPVTVADGGVTLKCPTKDVDFSGLPANDTSSLVLKPESPLPTGEKCNVIVNATDVSDANNENMAMNHPFTFTIIKNPIIDAAPFVTTTMPADRDTGVSTDADITINFSEPVFVLKNIFDRILKHKSIIIDCSGTSVTYASTPPLPASNTSKLVLKPTSPLPVDRDCTVRVRGKKIKDVDDKGDKKDKMVMDHTFSFSTRKEETFSIKGTAQTDTEHFLYQDFGLVFAPNINYVGVYSSVHFYFSPINNNVPPQGLAPLQRISIFAGFALQEIGSTNVEFANLINGAGSPVIGVGFRMENVFGLQNGNFIYRLVDNLQVNCGVMFFKQKNPNPLVTTDHTKTAYAISFTYNIEVQKLLGPLVALF